MQNTSWADPLLVQTKSFNKIIGTTYITICPFIHVNLSPPHKHSSCESMTHSTFVLNCQSCGKKYLLWLDAGTLSELFCCTLTLYIPVGGLSWMGGWSLQKEGTTSSPLLCYWQSHAYVSTMGQRWMEYTGPHWHLEVFPSSSWLPQLGLDTKNLRSFLVTPKGNGQLRKLLEFPDNHSILPCILE